MDRGIPLEKQDQMVMQEAIFLIPIMMILISELKTTHQNKSESKEVKGYSYIYISIETKSTASASKGINLYWVE